MRVSGGRECVGGTGCLCVAACVECMCVCVRVCVRVCVSVSPWKWDSGANLEPCWCIVTKHKWEKPGKKSQ